MNARLKLGRCFKDLAKRLLVTNIHMVENQPFLSFFFCQSSDFHDTIQGNAARIDQVIDYDHIVSLSQQTYDGMGTDVSAPSRNKNCSCHAWTLSCSVVQSVLFLCMRTNSNDEMVDMTMILRLLLSPSSSSSSSSPSMLYIICFLFSASFLHHLLASRHCSELERSTYSTPLGSCESSSSPPPPRDADRSYFFQPSQINAFFKSQ